MPAHPLKDRSQVRKVMLQMWRHTHFPKDQNCGICLRTKITRVLCRRRNEGSITADHRVLNEGSESGNNHGYAVVVQDLATQWIQSYPCEKKDSQETEKSSRKFLEPSQKPKVVNTDNSLEFGKSCEALSWNHRTSTPYRTETKGIAEMRQTTSKRGKISRIVAIRIG